MTLKIFHTPRAKETLNSVYDFIYYKFGSRSAERFAQKAEKVVGLIAEYPFMFKASAIDENVRIALISKQCSLFYRVTHNSIDLLFFWDNRQEPILPDI